MKASRVILFSLVFVLNSACRHFSTDYSGLQTFDEKGNLQVVIENSKGATTNVVYDFKLKEYAEQGELIQPHPANKGFVASTIISSENNHILPLEALVISKNLNRGETISVKPIGILKYKIEHSIRYKIVGIPTVNELMLMPIKNFEEFSLNNVELRQQITDWILSKNENKPIQLLGWYDEEEALSIIKAHQVRS